LKANSVFDKLHQFQKRRRIVAIWRTIAKETASTINVCK